ncbi:RNA polymerase sigma factor [Brevibacillus sp. 7WMA2]|uniref:RNA polymerase sigma factor n=1 Tax=Brevibacillus TaxID=55080 RepID=UPI0002404C2C|nr:MULTISPECIES: RNA polymerase sigma factor [Brevibacillus]MCZ0835406.1 RNA polymerase sigma factor [Brevibacillus halotolerans]MCR8963251.1 RNA polymerase sigma factor [Brevibacillus laterosporus]PCN45240.1 RNA polymerase [Brevibacillus laterosporus]QIC06905.1 RNA polymerase sigma factor [Brevibacillus sp. 7WMA2]CCF14925.1 RNA polymerase sigma factor, sigma-70 family protein [Brevibacillus laterosporus GI-9]
MEENHYSPITGEGGPVGFEALVQPHLPTAFRVAFLIVHDYHFAQDAVQEALWEAYQSLYRYDERKGTSFRAWFMKIVTHRALNMVRRKKKTEAYADSIDPDQNPLESILQKEQEQQIWRAIQSMTPKHRSAVILYYYEEFSVAEIAKILGVFEGTVKSRLHKARKLIAEKIQAEKETQVMTEIGVIMHD